MAGGVRKTYAATAYSMIHAIDAHAPPLTKDLAHFGERQPARRASVTAYYGIGGLLAPAIWSELGDCQRFTRSEQAIRHTGLDVTADQSDRKRLKGHLSRQGPEILRWALFEAAKNSSRHVALDHDYYAEAKTATTARSPRSPSPVNWPDAAITPCGPWTPRSSTPWPRGAARNLLPIIPQL